MQYDDDGHVHCGNSGCDGAWFDVEGWEPEGVVYDEATGIYYCDQDCFDCEKEVRK